MTRIPVVRGDWRAWDETMRIWHMLFGEPVNVTRSKEKNKYGRPVSVSIEECDCLGRKAVEKILRDIDA